MKIKENAPYMYLIMLTPDEGYQMINVVVECNILPESGNLTTAILDLFSSYYTFVSKACLCYHDFYTALHFGISY